MGGGARGGGGSFHMTGVKLCTNATSNLFALSADLFPPFHPFPPVKRSLVYSGASITPVYFHFSQADARLLRSCKTRCGWEGEDIGSVPKDASCHENLIKKKVCLPVGASEEEKEREEAAAAACTTADTLASADTI